MAAHEIAIDCGSGGTRVWQKKGGGGVERLRWPGGGKAPVLSRALQSASGREKFAAAVLQLPSAPFIGATAGLRHALQTGRVSEDDVEAFRALLPPGTLFVVLSPLDEAKYELRALRQVHADQSVAMISLGGKSMQLGREDSLVSLPFAMHLGYDLLQTAGPSWIDNISAANRAYEMATERAISDQQLEPISGLVVGVTDVMDVATSLQLIDGLPISRDEFLKVLGLCVDSFRKDSCVNLSHHDFHLLARSLALQAVVGALLTPDAQLIFPSTAVVTWTGGFFCAD